MESRRNVIKKISAIFAINSFATNKVLACMGGGTAPPIIIHTAKNNLKNYHEGKFKEFLNNQYKNKWVLSEGIEFHSREKEQQPVIIEDPSIVPINVSANFKYNKSEVYCSDIDIIYKNKLYEGGGIQYTVASISIAKETLPYFSTRFRMSSEKAEVYAAITLKYINSNQVKEVRVSMYPIHFKVLMCSLLIFEYINA